MNMFGLHEYFIEVHISRTLYIFFTTKLYVVTYTSMKYEMAWGSSV
jgi:hypothetical protein